jgi:hypothetical protein
LEGVNTFPMQIACEPSMVVQSEGQMQGQSVSREHFGHTTGGERAEQKRPQESGILKGEGTFSSETQKRVDFGPKKGERAEAKRPVDSTLFRVIRGN